MRYFKSLAAALLATTLILETGQVGASVPGKPFTETACEEHSDSVARLYKAGLGREPEKAGFEFWLEEYTAGSWPFPQMAQFFVDSDEFNTSYGALNDAEFVQQLYRNILGREGETAGIEFWTNELAGGITRATLLMRFAESVENIANSATAQPALGAFNQGLDERWRCGPDLTAHLLPLSDLSAGWSAYQPAPVGNWGECQDVFRSLGLPVQNAFQFNDFMVVTQSSATTMATQLGVDRFFAKVEARVAQCRSFLSTDGLEIVGIDPIPFDIIGERTAAYGISYYDPDGAWSLYSYVVFFEVGTTIGGVLYSHSQFQDIYTPKVKAEQLYERLEPVVG